MSTSFIKLYLEHRVFLRLNEDVNLIISSLRNKLQKMFPEIINYDSERIVLVVSPEQVEEYKNKGYVVGEISDKPTIILSKIVYELPQDTYNEAVDTINKIEKDNLLSEFAVVEIIDSRFTDILGV